MAQSILDAIPSVDANLSPMEIWCNEAQERYVIAIAPQDLACFEQIAQRECCPFAVVGKATEIATLAGEQSKASTSSG